MWASIMDEIISQEPTLSVQRTLDAKHYILNRWNKTHDTPMDESAVMLFLCLMRSINWACPREPSQSTDICFALRTVPPTSAIPATAPWAVRWG